MLESEDILSVTSEVLNAGVCCICLFFQMELAGDTCGVVLSFSEQCRLVITVRLVSQKGHSQNLGQASVQ